MFNKKKKEKENGETSAKVVVLIDYFSVNLNKRWNMASSSLDG